MSSHNHGPALQYSHREHVVRNINREFQQQLTFGQRVADGTARVVGSWKFIIYQSLIFGLWMAVNAFLVFMAQTQPGYFDAWDPYPFVLLNLLVGFQAAYTGPVVMMSQNRQAEKDRMMVEQDYTINKKAEEEVEVLMNQLIHQDTLLLEIITRLEKLETAINSNTGIEKENSEN